MARKVALFTVDVAIDLTNYKPGQPMTAAAEVLKACLTANMQLHNGGDGALVDWKFASDKPWYIEEHTPDLDNYEEDEVWDV